MKEKALPALGLTFLVLSMVPAIICIMALVLVAMDAAGATSDNGLLFFGLLAAMASYYGLKLILRRLGMRGAVLCSAVIWIAAVAILILKP